MKIFSIVEVNKPPNITLAIGLWISFPGKSPAIASGISAKPAVSAVIKMGESRSTEPSMTVSYRGLPSSSKVL